MQDLPYGQRRLLAIARAVATQPSVLLLDEPAAGLGDAETAELAHLVRRLADDWGMAILLVEHDMNFVMTVCDEIVVLDFGRKIAEGAPDVVRRDPAVIAAYLGQSEEEPDEVSLEDAEAAEELEVTRDRRRARTSTPSRPQRLGDAGAGASRPAASSAGYGPQPVVHDLDLEVRPGEVVALLGPNGAGKTTTMLALRRRAAAARRARWRSTAPSTKAPLHKRAQHGLVFVTEEKSVFKGLTARDNLRVGGVDLEDALALFPELERRLDVRGGLLSGGEQQMLSLARGLCRKPRVLLADELSLGLAPMVVTRLLQAVRDARRRAAARRAARRAARAQGAAVRRPRLCDAPGSHRPGRQC